MVPSCICTMIPLRQLKLDMAMVKGNTAMQHLAQPRALWNKAAPPGSQLLITCNSGDNTPSQDVEHGDRRNDEGCRYNKATANTKIFHKSMQR